MATRIIKAIAVAAAVSPLLAMSAFAQGPAVSVGLGGHLGFRGHGPFHSQGAPQKRPGVFGSVTAVNGTVITLTSRGFGPNSASTTYSVDADAATVQKNGSAASISDIAVGDTLMIDGSVDGTAVTATAIRDMKPFAPRGDRPAQPAPHPQQPAFEGNGQPVIMGDVTANVGGTLTVTAKAGVTYQVSASDAKVVHGGKDGSLADVAVGDRVVVQGAVSGTSVTASAVIDQTFEKPADGGDKPAPAHDIFGMIHNFLGHLFGF